MSGAAGDLQKRLVSKQWKDRITAYEELGELLVRDASTSAASPSSTTATAEGSSIARYAPYLKRMVADTANPRAQETALSTVVSFLAALSSSSAASSSTPREQARACPPELRKEASEVSLALIEKCLAGRSTIKEKAIQALLLFLQIGALEPVMGQLLKGCTNKVAKVAATCLFCLKEAVRLFGSPPIPLEPVLPILKASFDHSVQEVRTEALQLTVEFHTWLGASFDASIQDMQLRPAQIKELEAAYEARAAKDPSPPTPERKVLLNSGNKVSTRTSDRKASLLSSREEDDMANELEGLSGEGSQSMDPVTDDSNTDSDVSVEIYVPAGDSGSKSDDEPSRSKEKKDVGNGQPINLLSALSSEWYKEVSTGSWQKRKEQLDTLISLCGSSQRLQTGDYSKLIKALQEILRDSTTTSVVAATTVKAIGALAKGLGRDFLPYAKKLVPLLLDDFKTKRTLVGAVVHEVLDEMHNSCFSISDITNEVGEGLTNKVPRVRSECLKWLKRCIANTQGATVSNLGPLSELLLKCVDDSQVEVRDAAFAVISLLSKYHGDAFTQELSEGDRDRARLTKLKELTRSGSGVLSTAGKAGSSSTASPATPNKGPSTGTLGGRPRPRTGSTSSPAPSSADPASTSSTPATPAVPSSSTPAAASPYAAPTRRPNKPQPLNLNQTTSVPPSPLLSPRPSPSPSAAQESSKAGSTAAVDENGFVVPSATLPPVDRDSALAKARESMGVLRAGLEQQLAALERQLEEAEARSVEDHHFAADMHAWNLSLLAQQKADQQRIQELEAASKDREERQTGRQYLPSPEEMQSMTRDQLDELERRQEEFLLTIRKIKISLIR